MLTWHPTSKRVPAAVKEESCGVVPLWALCFGSSHARMQSAEGQEHTCRPTKAEAMPHRLRVWFASSVLAMLSFLMVAFSTITLRADLHPNRHIPQAH